MGNITQKWVNVLLPFVNGYKSRLSGAEIARQSGVPQQTASRILKLAVKAGIINYCIEGRNKMFYFDFSKSKTKTIFSILENHKALIFANRAKEAYILIDELLTLAEGVIVFGSYSSFRFNNNSDLDLVLLGGNNLKKLNEIKERCPIAINEHLCSFKEFKDLLRNKNPLALEVLNNHTLFGDVSKIVDIFCESLK